MQVLNIQRIVAKSPFKKQIYFYFMRKGGFPFAGDLDIIFLDIVSFNPDTKNEKGSGKNDNISVDQGKGFFFCNSSGYITGIAWYVYFSIMC